MNTPEDFNTVKKFIKNNFKHFNAAALIDAAQAYVEHLKKGGKMMITLAGAMSTAELGISLAEMIRQGKVHAITCTGANLEEDLFNLVAHSHYKRVPHYRDLSPEQEVELLKQKFNRVTDTCIPEDEAMRRLEQCIWPLWAKADQEGKRFFPYEYFYQMIRNGSLDQFHDTDPKNSWVVAACEKGIPIFVPGWEDSTLGNEVVAGRLNPENPFGCLKSFNSFKSGLEVMEALVHWYRENSKDQTIGFFQIGGGIAGDFPICVVPLIRQDMFEKVPLWGYFCQISESKTSYGGYSGAPPNEKITWEKLDVTTPRFVIESDASIVAPLVFAYVLATE